MQDARNQKVFTISQSPREKAPFQCKSPFLEWLSEQSTFYCSITSLHGWSHLVRKDHSLLERVVWGLLCLIASVIASLLLYISLDINALTPTVTVIESTHYPTWNIPFPAITICNVNKINQRSLESHMKHMQVLFFKGEFLYSGLFRTLPENVTYNEAVELIKLMVHFNGEGSAPQKSYDLANQLLTMNNYSVDQFLIDLKPTCEDMLEKCMWKGAQVRCDSTFQTIVTTKGYCCSFNYFGAKKIITRTRKGRALLATEPRRVSACGFQTGLSVILNPAAEDYVVSSISTYGFRVLVHGPYTYPSDNAETKFVQSGLEAYISVLPEATYSTPEVISKTLSIRNCYEPTEVQLESVTKYTHMNCLMECRRLMLMELCGCVPYNFPLNGSEKLCQMSDLTCFVENKPIFNAAEPPLNLTLPMLENASFKGLHKGGCGCLPDCDFNSYITEISTGILNRAFSYSSQSFFQGLKLSNQTILHVFYNDLVSTRYRTDMYQNWMSVLAMFGGLTGLFLGFSLVTGYEITYVFTIRGLFDLAKYCRRRRRSSPAVSHKMN